MKSFRILTGVILLLAGIGLAGIGVRLWLQPNEYESTATVHIRTPPVNPGVYDPYFIQAEFEIIQSHSVLRNVIATLNLSDRWSKKYNKGQRLSDSEVEEMIRRKLELKLVRNTQFLQIKMFDEDPSAAAALANAIALSYREYIRQQPQRPIEQGVLADLGGQLLGVAVPSIRPVGPNRYLAAVILGCGLFLMIGGMVCLKPSEG
jgi:uncharacterized protein involved in exopolysaccharide biosynthesis